MTGKSLLSDKKNIRRSIRAEDPEWHLILVPSFAEICIQCIVKNFEQIPMFEEIPADQKKYVMEKLPTSLPFQITMEWIPDGVYWKRCCEKWQRSDVYNHGNSWKQMFSEITVQDIIESFIPDVTSIWPLLDAVSVCKYYIKKLNISQLLLPVREYQVKKINEEYDSQSTIIDEYEYDYDYEEPIKLHHFDFTILLDQLICLEELHLSYRIKNCGMNFEWEMFEMTDKDYKSLGCALKSCKTLKLFKLHQSLVDDNICRMLVKSLLDHPSLRELDFSNNLISDRGVKAICKLVKTSKLEVLNLTHNRISDLGAKMIAHALSSNPPLSKLILRFNCLMDVGGQAICKSLLENTTLSYLHLGGNELTTLTAFALSRVLEVNTTLRKINLSSNKLGRAGGTALVKALSQNSTVIECDVRQTNIDKINETAINNVVLNNQKLLPKKEKPSGKTRRADVCM